MTDDKQEVASPLDWISVEGFRSIAHLERLTLEPINVKRLLVHVEGSLDRQCAEAGQTSSRIMTWPQGDTSHLAIACRRRVPSALRPCRRRPSVPAGRASDCRRGLMACVW